MNPVADDELPWPEDAVEVARIVGAWGVKGWFKVQPFSADPQAVFSSKRWFLRPSTRPGLPTPTGAAQPLPAVLRITQARLHGDGVVACAQEVVDRAAAEALRGASVHISRASFPTAKDDEYYWVDLIGLDVVNRQGESLGRVTDLSDTGAHSVLHLQAEGPDGRNVERMIPFVAAYIDQVDRAARRIVADWGLDY